MATIAPELTNDRVHVALGFCGYKVQVSGAETPGHRPPNSGAGGWNSGRAHSSAGVSIIKHTIGH